MVKVIDNIVRNKISYAIANGKVSMWNKAAYNPIGESMPLYMELLNGLPHELIGGDGEPSLAENVIYCTMAMWGHHQHCNDAEDRPAHRDGISLGTSIRMLKGESVETVERAERAFKLLATFVDTYGYPFDWQLINTQLKRIIDYLRIASVPTDYGMLAEQLYSVAIGKSDMQEIGRSLIGDYYADSCG